MRTRPTEILAGTCSRLLASAVAATLLATGAGAAELGLITGGEKGTYYQFGLNLRQLLQADGTTLSVYNSKGSIENIYAVYQRPNTQLGIVQSDVLAFVTRVQSDPVLKRIAKKTRMVFPLYNEEVHLLGRRELRDFDDLADRRVAVGREGSGTYLTARLLFKLADVAPKEMVFIDTDEALAELKAGRLDAMFYVAGYPVKLFTDHVAAADDLALIPITNKSITEFYAPAETPAQTYGWQPAALPTVAVKAVLVSFDFRGQNCDRVGRFARTVSERLEWLVRNGHPKWRTVDLNAPLKGWEQYDCVRRHLGKPVTASAGPARADANPVMQAIKTILAE